MITTGFVMMLWSKMYATAGLPQQYPIVFSTKAACEAKAKEIRAYYETLYDPEHQYSKDDVVDAHCF